MAADPLIRRAGGLAGLMDAALSRALRYDQSRTDVLKWIAFARNLFLLLFVSVLSMGTLAVVVSTRQAAALLHDSLVTQGDAVASAVARAAFVPLSLDDRQALRVLLDSYAGLRDVAFLRIEDTRGRLLADRAYLPPDPAHRPLERTVHVTPEASPTSGRTVAERGVAGVVRVGMSEAYVRGETRRIVMTNLVGLVGMSLVVLLLGMVFLRQVVTRMRDLVGEARMAEALQQANGELEAFSYSVSHDLRAPLRAIDGFSQILLEDYAGSLDETGRGYLGRVRAGCQRMGHLIDDLLRLSRVIRQDMRIEAVDVSALAQRTIDRCRTDDPGRSVETAVTPGLTARADAGLLSAAFDNLIGNAWKFTARKPSARIEVGRAVADGAVAYFVRDNGAGFDMAYAGKLFGAFQRLHAQEEFAGTGIGLATVKRIVARHGGRIWAESAPGRGATFWFTLGGQAGRTG